MEALRDFALADYENLPEERKMELYNQFNEMVAKGTDFSKYFDVNTISPVKLSDLFALRVSGSELYGKKITDFGEFITLTYIRNHPEAVIVCNGCETSLIAGRPYFTCEDCFNDDSKTQKFDLCCDCYRSKRFQQHGHISFFPGYLLQRYSSGRGERASQEYGLERKNEVIDRAMIEFGNEFMKFARSITTDNGWDNLFAAILNIDKEIKLYEMPPRMALLGEKSPKNEEERNSTMSRRKPIDLFGRDHTNVGM